jgi:hypothetical protein
LNQAIIISSNKIPSFQIARKVLQLVTDIFKIFSHKSEQQWDFLKAGDTHLLTTAALGHLEVG